MMNEEIDEFERRLGRQPLRPVPAQWREEILAVCRESRAGNREAEQRSPSTLVSRLSTLLWPHPAAWAGLAAIWILILAVDFSVRDNRPVTSAHSAPPPTEVIVQLRQQQRLLAELIGPREVRDADRSKPWAPQPRSEWVEFQMV